MPTKKKALETSFATEVEMCAQFISKVGDRWTAYPETGGWDILLSRKSDGFQIGVEAKLKFNKEVLTQALDGRDWSLGPDCRAILVPEYQNSGLDVIAHHIGITVIRIRMIDRISGLRTIRGIGFEPQLPKVDEEWTTRHWTELAPDKRVPLPDYVPDVAAGAPAPMQLTAWKIGAIKIAVLLELRGIVTCADFKHVGINIQRWVMPGVSWLTKIPEGFIVGPWMPDFRAQHPRVYEEVKADFPTWAPKPASQGRMI